MFIREILENLDEEKKSTFLVASIIILVNNLSFFKSYLQG